MTNPPNHILLIIHDERGTRYYVRPVDPPPPKIERTRLVLKSRIAVRCVRCGEWECVCEETAL